MARRGSFSFGTGSSGANLTSLIHSLYLQQQSATDSGMFDAWQNGGAFDGKPVDDERILAYIKTRQAQYSKDDPLYSRWADSFTQTSFSIGEQKASLAYARGGSGSGMAAFYRSWIGKVPADSAFGRSIAEKAAKWARSAQGAATGAARSRASAALSSAATRASGAMTSWAAIEGSLTQALQANGFEGMAAEDADGGLIERTISQGVINPLTGKPITMSDWHNAAVGQYNALGTVIAIKQANGDSTTGATNARAKFVSGTLLKQNAVDDYAKYDAANQSFSDAQGACAGEPSCLLAAAAAYQNDLKGIRDTAASAGGLSQNSPLFVGALTNEITALGGGRPPGGTVQDMSSKTGVVAEGASDAMHTMTGVLAAEQAIRDIADGLAYYGQKNAGGNLGVRPMPAGGLPEGTQRGIVMGTDGEPHVTYLVGQAVTARTVVDAAGGAVNVTGMSAAEIAGNIANGTWAYGKGSSIVGYIYTSPTSHKTSYGVRNAGGGISFTNADPFGNLLTGDIVPVAGAGDTSPAPTTFSGAVDPTQPQSAILRDPSLSGQDIITAIGRDPAAFGAVGQAILVNVDAVQTIKGNDELPSTAEAYAAKVRSDSANAAALQALQVDHAIASLAGPYSPQARSASLAGNVAGQYGAGFYGVAGPSTSSTTYRGMTLATNPGAPPLPVPIIAATPTPTAQPTIKMPTLVVPSVAPPRIISNASTLADTGAITPGQNYQMPTSTYIPPVPTKTVATPGLSGAGSYDITPTPVAPSNPLPTQTKPVAF